MVDGANRARVAGDRSQGSPWSWGAWSTVAITLGLVLAVWVAPSSLRPWLEKEGPVEHLSHVVLAIAVLVWLTAALREPRRTGLWLVTLLMLVLLLEETDWGLVYGFPSVGMFWRETTGMANLHNAWSGHSYPLFAIPLLVWFGVRILSARVRSGARAFLGPGLPTAHETAAFFAIVVSSILAPLIWRALERQWDELFESGLYLLLLAVGARAVTQVGGAGEATAGTRHANGPVR